MLHELSVARPIPRNYSSDPLSSVHGPLHIPLQQVSLPPLICNSSSNRSNALKVAMRLFREREREREIGITKVEVEEVVIVVVVVEVEIVEASVVDVVLLVCFTCKGSLDAKTPPVKVSEFFFSPSFSLFSSSAPLCCGLGVQNGSVWLVRVRMFHAEDSSAFRILAKVGLCIIFVQ